MPLQAHGIQPCTANGTAAWRVTLHHVREKPACWQPQSLPFLHDTTEELALGVTCETEWAFLATIKQSSQCTSELSTHHNMRHWDDWKHASKTRLRSRNRDFIALERWISFP